MEEFANAFRSHAHENVFEFGRRDEEERNARFASDGSRHEGFAGARRPGEKNAARRCGSERIENGGVLNGLKRGGEEGYAEIIDGELTLHGFYADEAEGIYREGRACGRPGKEAFMAKIRLDKAVADYAGTGKNSSLIMGFYQAVRAIGGVIGALMAGVLYGLDPKVPFIFACAGFAISVVCGFLFYTATRKADAAR